jgi:lysozyme
MQIGENGIALIKTFEGCKLTTYDDVRGVKTIGIGHTANVTDGECITESQAIDFLKQDIGWAESIVSRLVDIDLSQNQFDALVAFTFNVGSGNFQHSTLLALLNKNKIYEASQEFVKWDKSGGVVVAGLLRRREAERDLFLKID